MEKDSHIFIAGSTGLVGSAILRNLLAKGYTHLSGSYFRRTPTPIKGSEVNFVQADLANQEATARLFAELKPDYVVLAAAHVGGIIANNTYRADFIYQNLQIQNNVIHQSYMQGVKKLLLLGSSCI